MCKCVCVWVRETEKVRVLNLCQIMAVRLFMLTEEWKFIFCQFYSATSVYGDRLVMGKVLRLFFCFLLRDFFHAKWTYFGFFPLVFSGIALWPRQL